MAKKKPAKKSNLPYVSSIGAIAEHHVSAAVAAGWDPKVEGHDEPVTHVCPVPGCCRQMTTPKSDKVVGFVCPEHRKSVHAYILHNQHVKEGKCPPKKG